MRILFLDDNPNRRKAFKQRSIGCIVDFACDADEAMTFLDTDTEYDLIMLDHDLGGAETEGMILEDGKDGRTVAGFIAQKHPKHASATIIIHSLNQVGARMMAAVLKDAGYNPHVLPFGWQKFEKTEDGCTFTRVVNDVPPHEIDSPPDEG